MDGHLADTGGGGGRGKPPTINIGCRTEKIALPLPPALGEGTRFEMDIYARFMRHLRQAPGGRMDVKLLCAIRFTADMTDVPEALVTRVLVDLGLRAPRRALPASFLDFADRMLLRQARENGGSLPASVLAIGEHWNRIGESRFCALPSLHYALPCTGLPVAGV